MEKGKFILCAFSFITVSVVAANLGGWKNLNPKGEEVRMVAGFALNQIDERSNSMFRSVLVKVIDAKRQTVSGFNYQLTLELGQSDCMKGQHVENLQACKATKVQECTVTVWVQPWKNSKKLTDFHCSSLLDLKQEENLLIAMDTKHKLKPEHNRLPLMPGPVLLEAPEVPHEQHVLPLMPGPVMPGAPMRVDARDGEVVAAASFFLQQLNARSNSAFKMGLVEVKSVTSQVVAGVKYTLVLEVGPTKCQNTEQNKDLTLEQCPVTNSGQAEECRVVIWDQAWKKPRYQVLESSCGTQTPPNPHVDSTMDQSAVPRPDDGLIGGGDHMAGSSFRAWQAKYNKAYTSKDEEEKRFRTFKDNLRKIRKLNERELGSAVYKVNEFADMSYEEFKKEKLGFKPEMMKGEQWPQAEIPKGAYPKTYDWRDHSAVTPVKNQGSCGSCWAFSTTGNIEGQWAVKKKSLVSLSEQELVDCDKIDDGCNGGLPSNAYHEIMRLGGLETEKAYPYEGEDEKCHFKRSLAKVDINGAVNISTNEGDMAAWLFKNGPISIGINAFAMQFYWGGISHPWKIFCNPESLDHGVLIVGYGLKGSEPYWIVKNSWGSSWGEQGYYLVYRGAGVCGLNRMPTSSVIN